MRKTALSLGLEQAFGQTQQLTYSEEGFKDLFRKIYDKWKEWFPTTYWTLEGARQGTPKVRWISHARPCPSCRSPVPSA